MTTPEAQDVQSLALPHVTDETRRALGEVVVVPPDNALFSPEELAAIRHAPSELRSELRSKTTNVPQLLYRGIVFGKSFVDNTTLSYTYYVGINPPVTAAYFALYKATEVDEAPVPLYQEPYSRTIASTFSVVVDGISKMTRKYRKTAELLNDYKHRFRNAVSRDGLEESETTVLYFEESEYYTLAADDPETAAKIKQLTNDGYNFGADVTYFATCRLSVMKWIENSLNRIQYQGADPEDKMLAVVKTVISLLDENACKQDEAEALDDSTIERKLLEQSIKDNELRIIQSVVNAEEEYYQPTRDRIKAREEEQERSTVEDLQVLIDELNDVHEAAQKSSNVHLQGVVQASLMAMRLCLMPNTDPQRALLNNEVTIKAISDIVRESTKLITAPSDDGEAQSFEPAKVLHVVQQKLVEILKSWGSKNGLRELETKSFISEFEDPVKFYSRFFAEHGENEAGSAPDAIWQQYQQLQK